MRTDYAMTVVDFKQLTNGEKRNLKALQFTYSNWGQESFEVYDKATESPKRVSVRDIFDVQSGHGQIARGVGN